MRYSLVPDPYHGHRLSVIEAVLKAIPGTMKAEEGIAKKSKSSLPHHPGALPWRALRSARFPQKDIKHFKQQLKSTLNCKPCKE